MNATLASRAWVVRDREGGGYVNEREDGEWELVANVSQAKKFDNEPEAFMTGVVYFPTLCLRTVPVKV